MTDYTQILPQEYHEIARSIEDHLATKGASTLAELHAACGAGTTKVSYTSAITTMGELAKAKRLRIGADSRITLWKR